MTEKKRRRYVPPRIVDLSGYSASGEPQGECYNGPYPYYNCVTGPVYESSCVDGPTVDTSTCEAGGAHTLAACRPGGAAGTICVSGAHQNF